MRPVAPLRSEQTDPAAPVIKANSKSPSRIALDRLRKDKVAVVCFGIFMFFVLVAVFAPQLAALEGQNPFTTHQELVARDLTPTVGMSTEHWFGIEPRMGRDLFARWVYGARPSMEVAVLATTFTTALGVVMGLIAGFAGGIVDRVISWTVDFLMSLPILLFAMATPLLFMNMLGIGEDAGPEQIAKLRFWGLIFVLSLFGWAGLARLIRGEVLSLREREFVAAARVLGVSTSKILFKELLPNLVAPIVISVSMALPGYITAEAGLTFLGVGLIEPTPSWGVTISQATTYYKTIPNYLWLPVLGVTLLVIALSLLGDAVRDAFDPKTRR